ncbi:MAG: SRPBCC family protein [Deltaproteobacteria bacterium]|nr:SRPBCC family protein [Deltaproteobacteria bacterium]
MSAATRTIEVNASPADFLKVLTDFEAYPGFLDGLGMTDVRVESRTDNEAVVEHSVKKMGKTVKYTLRYKWPTPNKMEWTFIRGQMMSENKGSWTLEEMGEGKTRAVYSAEIKFGMLVPKSVIKVMVERELPELMGSFKKKAEA